MSGSSQESLFCSSLHNITLWLRDHCWTFFQFLKIPLGIFPVALFLTMQAGTKEILLVVVWVMAPQDHLGSWLTTILHKSWNFTCGWLVFRNWHQWYNSTEIQKIFFLINKDFGKWLQIPMWETLRNILCGSLAKSFFKKICFPWIKGMQV